MHKDEQGQQISQKQKNRGIAKILSSEGLKNFLKNTRCTTAETAEWVKLLRSRSETTPWLTKYATIVQNFQEHDFKNSYREDYSVRRPVYHDDAGYTQNNWPPQAQAYRWFRIVLIWGSFTRSVAAGFPIGVLQTRMREVIWKVQSGKQRELPWSSGVKSSKTSSLHPKSALFILYAGVRGFGSPP